MNIFMRFAEGKKKALTLSYDDGVHQDKRLIQVLNRYGIRATFNINSGILGVQPERMSVEQAKELYTNSVHEVAVHGKMHPFLDQVPLPVAVQDVLEDRMNLEKMFGTIVRGMAYPYGRYTDEVVDAMKNIGIAYSRTVITTHDFRIPTDWLRLTTTCHHKDKRLMELVERFVDGKTNREPWLFYLWGHSYEFDNDDNWELIEGFAKAVGNKEDIWYATNIQIYDYIEAYRNLQFSVDCKYIYNPTAITLWLEKDGELIEIQPGEKVKGE